MGYSAIADQVNSQSKNIINKLNSIEKISQGSIWNGSAYDNLNENLKSATNKGWIENGNLATFASAMYQLQQYKNNKEMISQLSAQLSSIPNDIKHSNQRASISAKISALESKNRQLRGAIQSLLSSINSNKSEINQITFEFGSQEEYLISKDDMNLEFDLYKILSAYENTNNDENTDPILEKLEYKQMLSEYYNQIDSNGNVIEGSGMEYIVSVIEDVQKKYTGREAAVNSALAVLKLAADKGYKIDYEAHGTSSREPYVSTETLLEGIDCNPFTSWVVDKGTPGGFQWRPVPNFESVGETMDDWTKAQPGDVFVYSEGNGTAYGHVGVIIENDPENKVFITAEAKGKEAGIVLTTRDYDSLARGNYKVQDMTNVYNGTENTDRKEFANYDKTQRKL